MSAIDQLDKHVYFDPAYCSDVLIQYKDTIYHAHRAILAAHSKYFCNLFEAWKAQECGDNIVRLPTLTTPTFLEEEIQTSTMEKLLRFFYHQQFPSLLNHRKMISAPIDYLSHYFQCESLELKLQTDLADLIGSDHSFSKGSLLCRLHEAEVLHWDAVREKAIVRLTKNQYAINAAEIEQESSVLLKISMDSKSEMLKRCLNIK